MNETTTVKESDALQAGSNATVVYDWKPVEYPPMQCDEWTAADLLAELGDSGL